MRLRNAILMLVIFSVLIVSGCTQKEAPQQTTQPTIEEPTTEETQAGEVKEFTMTAKKWEFSPSTITVKKGDAVKLSITSIDVAHGFGLNDFGIKERLEPGKTTNIEFVADKTGTFTFFCSVFCGDGHGEMTGTLIVE